MEQILLKDICDLDNGYAFKSDDYVDESNTLNCRMSNIRPDGSFDIMYSSKYLPDEFAEKYSEYLLKDGDLIIAMTDMAGDPKILGVPTVVDTQGYNVLLNQRVGRLRFIRDGVNADYLKLALQSPKVRSYLKRFAGGGVQLNVSKKDILNAPVLMRSENEQMHIADVFKKVIRIIKQREQELEYFDNLIKSRFVELFGDMTLNPNGWEMIPLGQACDVRDGTHDSPQYFTEGYPLVTSKNVTGGKIDFTDCSLICKEDYNKINERSRVDFGDILMPMIGTVGKPVIVDVQVEFAIKNVALIKFCEESKVTNVFVKALLQSDYFDRAVISKIRGGTQKFIALGDIRKLEICLPPMELQEQFAAFVHQVTKLKFEVQKSMDETQTLMDSLMQQYFG